jgi:hypothetical protein
LYLPLGADGSTTAAKKENKVITKHKFVKMSKLLKKESLYLLLEADCSATAKKKIKLLQSINLSKKFKP